MRTLSKDALQASAVASFGGQHVKRFCAAILALVVLGVAVYPASAVQTVEPPINKEQLKKASEDAAAHGDVAWMLVSTALVLFMVPGLALFYGGMARRKNVLG